MGELFKKIKEAFMGTPLSPEEAEKQKKEFEYQRVKAEIEAKKDRAKKLGVDKFMGELFEDLQHYPSWFQHSRHYTPLITDCKKLTPESRDNEKWEKWQITLKGKDYVFAFEKHNPPMPDENVMYHGTFETYLNNEKILSLKMSMEFNEYHSSWDVFNIGAFKEGEWIKDFKELYDASRKAHTDGMKKLEQGRLEKEKKEFGIE